MSFDVKPTDGAGADPVDGLPGDGLPGDGLPEDGLPADLAALAQQLCDDAAGLSGSYPADAERLARGLRRRSFWHGATLLRFSALAASLLMLIGGGGLWFAGQLGDHPASENEPVATKPNDTDDDSSKSANVNASHFVGVGVPIRPVGMTDRAQAGNPRDHLTAEDVLKMTGPKLDAYGDIRADESETMESFSF